MKLQTSTVPGWRAKAGWLCLLGLAVSGCAERRTTATVTGSVTYRGAPVPVGKVAFFGPNDKVASALIEDDGSYQATDVPLGLVRVAVSTPLPPPPEIEKAAKEGKRRFGKGKPITVPTNTVVIPAKYNDPAKSGLSLTVTQGSQPFAIDLK